VSEKSLKLENLTSVGARCEGVCGIARSVREQGRTLPRGSIHGYNSHEEGEPACAA
jgi:hypothetical protein